MSSQNESSPQGRPHGRRRRLIVDKPFQYRLIGLLVAIWAANSIFFSIILYYFYEGHILRFYDLVPRGSARPLLSAPILFTTAIAFILLFVLATTLLVPETVMAIVAGALFGFDKGLAAVIAGGFVAAALQFLLSRRVLRAPIQRALDSRPHLASIQNAIVHSEVPLQVLLRLTPLNPATLSYMFGAAGVRFPGFLLACLALVPHQLIEVYFGYAGRHVAKMASRVSPPLRLHDAIVVGGLVACLVAMVVVSRVARKAVADRVAETQAAEWGKGTS